MKMKIPARAKMWTKCCEVTFVKMPPPPDPKVQLKKGLVVKELPNP
jgi:hypothetical protein